MAKLSHEDILAYLEEATILELNDLVKAIEEKFGVSAAAPVAVAAAAPVEEKKVEQSFGIGATPVQPAPVVKPTPAAEEKPATERPVRNFSGFSF